MNGTVTMVLAIIGMMAIAVVAWQLVQRQEANDPELEKKLKADDERAQKSLRDQAAARGAAAGAAPGAKPSMKPPPKE